MSDNGNPTTFILLKHWYEIHIIHLIKVKKMAKLRIEKPNGRKCLQEDSFPIVYIVFHRTHIFVIFEPPHGKTNNLHRRKQRRRSASR